MITPDEFWERVKALAGTLGYDMTSPGHPEDHVANLVPVMEAYAAGFTDGWQEGRR